MIHAVLHDRPYTDPGIDDKRLVVERNAPRWIRSSAPFAADARPPDRDLPLTQHNLTGEPSTTASSVTL